MDGTAQERGSTRVREGNQICKIRKKRETKADERGMMRVKASKEEEIRPITI